MEFNADEIFQLAATIWEATLELPIEPSRGGGMENPSRSVACYVQISGAWNGAILLACPAEVARRAASIMFHAEPDDMAIFDLQDAVAELTNMIGGNFKALLPQSCYLSLPAVVEGGDYSTRIPGSRSIGGISFACEGNPVSISILEKIEQKAA
jgi:chemotaxis protein CheX